MRLISLALFCIINIHSIYGQNPSIKVLDTDFSKGSLIYQQTIYLEDAAKFHGHLCDGLAVGFIGLKEILYRLYPDSIIDRTNTRIVSKSSPCLTDIAIYLTGGRFQFNSFFVSDSIPYMYIVQRIDNGKSFGVNLKSGIKPAIIDSLGHLANTGKLGACGLLSLQKLENQFLKQMLSNIPQETYIVKNLGIYKWSPILINSFIKTDILNKTKKNCLSPIPD